MFKHRVELYIDLDCWNDTTSACTRLRAEVSHYSSLNPSLPILLQDQRHLPSPQRPNHCRRKQRVSEITYLSLMEDNNIQHSFWEIVPWHGMGPIHFLMDKSVMLSNQDMLGAILLEKNLSTAQQKKDVQDTYDQLKHLLSEEDFKIVLEGLNEFGEGLDDVSTTSLDSGISLLYKANQLLEIFADDRVTQLHFQGMPFFSSDPVELLAFISKQLNEKPRIKGDEVAFPEHHLFLFSFLRADGQGGYRVPGKKGRTVSLWNAERLHGEDLSIYQEIDLG